MRDVVIQLGHCYRRTGSTGTSGHRGTEQEFVSLVGHEMRDFLHLRGVDAVTVLADERPIPNCRVFIALHQDGSTNRTARGASVGYPAGGSNPALAATWKAMYQLAGWPSGFRPDNYTAALRRYYGFRRVTAETKILLEHGFATNHDDCNWMWDRIGPIAETNSRAIMHHLGHVTSPNQGEDTMGIRLEVHTDPVAKKTWAMYGSIEKPTVDLYKNHLPGAGEESPGGYYIVRDGVREGRMTQVGAEKFA